MPKISNKLIIFIILFSGILIAVAFLYLNRTKLFQETLLPPQKAAQKAVDYINQNILQEGVTASLIDATEENGVYKINFKIENQEFVSYVTKDGKLLFPEAINLEKTVESEPESQEETSTIGNFFVSKDEVCREEGKPIVYFFGSTGCSHCKWEHPIVEKIAENFEGYISFRNNMDSNADMDIFKKYSRGSIPTLVLGCKYYRIGSGESEGEELESKNLTALICKLTENQPSNICNSVQDLINQIP